MESTDSGRVDFIEGPQRIHRQRSSAAEEAEENVQAPMQQRKRGRCARAASAVRSRLHSVAGSAKTRMHRSWAKWNTRSKPQDCSDEAHAEEMQTETVDSDDCVDDRKRSDDDDEEELSPTCNHCVGLFSFFRINVVCAGCDASVCRSCAVPTEERPTTYKCLVCAKIEHYEQQLAKAYFPMSATWGKYQGIPAAIYRQWFCAKPAATVCLSESRRRSKSMASLALRHVLHSQDWKALCTQLCQQLQVKTCCVTLADKDQDLILATAGSMLPFSCFPSEIGMCEYTLSSPDQQLVLADVVQNASYRHNPMLVATKAAFYFGTSICLHGVAIGTLVVMDVKPRPEPFDEAGMTAIEQTCESIGDRLAVFVKRPVQSFGARVITKATQRYSRMSIY